MSENYIAMSGPAPYSNRFQVKISPHTARLSFMEVDEKEQMFFRTAVCISYPDLVALRDLLNEIVKDVEVH